MGHNKKMTPSRRKTEKKMKKVVENYAREQKLKKLEQERLEEQRSQELPASAILGTKKENA